MRQLTTRWSAGGHRMPVGTPQTVAGDFGPRTAHEGRTLREHLGLPRVPNRHFSRPEPKTVP